MSQIRQPTSQDTSVDQLTSQLAITSIAYEIKGQWVYFPPGTSIEEQLLILAGVQDYTLNGSAEQIFSTAEMSRTTTHTPSDMEGFDAKGAMSQRLDMLEDTELASLMHTNLRLNAPSQPTSTPTPPSSPPFAGYQGSYPPGSLNDLENMYTQALRQCNTPDNLANAPLPMCDQELWELSNFMQRQIWWMMADGDLRWMVKAPKAHPLYPYWVLPGTGERYAEAMEM
ncbi:hypothetical protein HBI56_053100 [Parastagonospora nodorum]|nr:hypothetical protein HBH98_187780 [Parastagonospora nodorum]KAH4367493.1 hypothetical protein HBH97_159520 [Parastagonospora nodorum]KAH4386209.1 hypothetical protein HBH99_172590 [Parastagonospora nodorum]KAH5034937.1 hypothetical protein HBI75_089490 [Parastagonospora nodorum]KAH5051649.1 hypothetical protein HBH96_168990 [Parastagonospora nodorum]